jgi:hypothetical protein
MKEDMNIASLSEWALALLLILIGVGAGVFA